ncbi:hypothetical protein E1286_24100 [Nonomuraea terrae]|uniref:Uncharacterized protein n=1 Tax=Nonomuraea terrae TaxID=2530383 RepID=A0A4R4YKF3_9ACTN|nr:hypothetical protein [Nonomuraea terrae]TDD45403.1 hypothetical protein E1286_24100 [Nonomuraea terrae]
MTTLTLTTTATDAASQVLRKMADLIGGPYNASLVEALHLATRDQALAEQAVKQLATTLNRHPRDLPLWDVTRPRDLVAHILRLAALGVNR